MSTPTVAVVGGGPCGALTSLALANRGFDVTLFEARQDPRTSTAKSRARSINLAYSARGIRAIRTLVGDELVERVLARGLAMRGRMIHKAPSSNAPHDTELDPQDYGVYEHGECINSISRSEITNILLDAVDAEPRISLCFGAKLAKMDLRGSKTGARLHFDGPVSEWQGDFVVGADGSHSAIRSELLRQARVDFKQKYAEHLYLELTIPPGPDDSFLMSNEHLHIWPRTGFMLIALPNLDKSFTLTLFAPASVIRSLDGQPDKITSFFQREFPDATRLMGIETLQAAWRENPKDGLVTVEVSPYHFEDRVVLLGDAAHAMVPFYGQGMNCALEDVLVFASILDRNGVSPSPPSAPIELPLSLAAEQSAPDSVKDTPLGKAFADYTARRSPAVRAIQLLAERNYTEMSSSVLSPLYLIRRGLDSALTKMLPAHIEWQSLYRMVTFRADLAYDEALRRSRWQDSVVRSSTTTLVCSAAAGLAAYLAWSLRLQERIRLR